jgi:putative ABC transport system permease protein
VKNNFMDAVAALKIALRQLVRNKSRNFLTMLGIIIGVAAVIAVVNAGNGAIRQSELDIQAEGANLITIRSEQKAKNKKLRREDYRYDSLTLEDLKAIQYNCKYVSGASPVIYYWPRVIYNNENWSTRLQGGNADFFYIMNYNLLEGRYFTESEVERKDKVVVIGQIVKEQLFGNQSPVGKIVRINKIPFTVLGVFETKGQSDSKQYGDDRVVIPYTVAMANFAKAKYLYTIQASAVSMELSKKACEEITALLRQRHNIMDEKAENDFSVRLQEDKLKENEDSGKVLTTLLIVIAAVSLIVGGIGIMNMMLVSVTERMREIGIRLALGAKRKDVIFQFITEAVVLSASGGILGIIFGIILTYIIFNLTKWPLIISYPAIFISFFTASSIGIFFGLYPALIASRLDPIETLRME